MIRTEHLTKHYGDFVALDDVSFEIAQGEIVGLLGPNGAGKSTTMRILSCSMPATAGEAYVADFDVHTQSMDVRRGLGYMPEIPPLYMHMTVQEYLMFVSKIKGVPRRLRKERVEYAIERCGLVEMRRRLTRALSKGYRQRTGLAQAIVHDPPVLILDEPTNGLDPRQIVEIRQLIKDLAGEHTVLLSTHILPEVTMTCERVVILNKGRVLADEKLETLTAEYGLEEVFIRLVTKADAEAELANGMDAGQTDRTDNGNGVTDD